MSADNSRINPKLRIVILCIVLTYELFCMLITLTVGSEIGFTRYVIDKGFVFVLTAPLLLALLIPALIYELRRFWGKSANRWGRYAFYVLIIAAFLGTSLWYAQHSPPGGKQQLTAMREYDEYLAAPLLKDISPEESTELESCINKNPLENDSSVITGKSDLAERIITVGQEVPPFAEPDNAGNSAVQEGYYSTTLHYGCASERVVELLIDSWDYADAITKEGSINGARYMFSDKDGQHLIIWNGQNLLEADYTGTASILDHLELYAKAI